jgi:DUF4097 and DUF4098 domain-containing protein YvlB
MKVTHLIVATTLAGLGLADPTHAAVPAGAQTGVAGVRHALPVLVAWQFPGPPPQGPGRGQPPPRVLVPPGPPQGIEAHEPFSRTLRLAPDGTLDLANLAGDIVVTGGAGDEVRIDAVKRAWHDTEAGARTLLEEMRVRVIERGGTIEVRTEGPRRRDWTGAVEYAVALPGRAHVTIRTVSGSVRVTNVAGELRAETISGNIVVAAVRRVRLVKTLSGDIDISNAEGQELTAGTVSGNLTARDLKVHTIDMESVSGEMRLTDVESARARIRSINGPIDYRGRLARSGHYELMSHSGNIRIAPAGAIGFDLDASTVSGSVRSELTLGSREDRRDPAGRPGLTRVRGTFGEAGAALSLRSFSGDILIAQP